MKQPAESKRTGAGFKEIYSHYKKRGFFNYVGRSVLVIILLYTLFPVFRN